MTRMPDEAACTRCSRLPTRGGRRSLCCRQHGPMLSCIAPWYIEAALRKRVVMRTEEPLRWQIMIFRLSSKLCGKS